MLVVYTHLWHGWHTTRRTSNCYYHTQKCLYKHAVTWFPLGPEAHLKENSGGCKCLWQRLLWAGKTFPKDQGRALSYKELRAKLLKRKHERIQSIIIRYTSFLQLKWEHYLGSPSSKQKLPTHWWTLTGEKKVQTGYQRFT